MAIGTFREWLRESELNLLDKLDDNDVVIEGNHQGVNWKLYNNFM